MPVEKEPVDIFDTSGTTPSGYEEAEELDDDESGEGASDEEEEQDDDSEEEDDDSEDDEEGDDDEDDDEEEDPRDAEIKRLNTLLKTKNQALRQMRKAKVTSGQAAEVFKPPYPDLKRSHELPQDEQDEMTDREKKLHDDNIEVKERLNEDARKAWEREQKEKESQINEDALTEDEMTDFVQASAQYLAKGDRSLANKIIKKFNQFNNDGLTEEQIEDRLTEAMQLVTGYRRAKEQGSGAGRGSAVKKKTKSHGVDVDKIVEEAVGDGAKKNYEL